MQDCLTLEEAIEFTAYGDLCANARRWLYEQARQNFIITINARERLFPIYGKLRAGNEFKRIDGLSLYSFKPIQAKTAASAYGLKEYGYNESDEYINLAEIRNRNGRPIKIIDVVFSEGTGFIKPDVNPALFNPSLLFGHGGFLCYTDILIPCADFKKAFPQINVEQWRGIVEAGTEEMPPFLHADGENNEQQKRVCRLTVETKKSIQNKKIKNNQKNQNGFLISDEKSNGNQNNQNDILKAEIERLKAALEQRNKTPAVAKAGRPIKYTELSEAIMNFVRKKGYKGKGQDIDFINGVLALIPKDKQPKSNSTITKAFQRLRKTGKIE